MLIYHGEIIRSHLQAAKMTLDELEAAVREHGVERIGEVDLAVLEVDGNISVLTENYQRASVKKRKPHKGLEKAQA